MTWYRAEAYSGLCERREVAGQPRGLLCYGMPQQGKLET